MSSENGFPFLVGVLTPEQSAAWNNDRALYLGPLNLAQAIEIYYRVNQYTLNLAAPLAIYGSVATDSWNNDEGQYDEVSLDYLSDTFTDSIPLNLTTINTSAVPPSEQALQRRTRLEPGGQLVFTGTVETANFVVSVSLSLFSDGYTYLRDDSRQPIYQSWQNYQCQRDGDDYYVPMQLSIGADWNGSVFGRYSPGCNGAGDTNNVGPTAYYIGAINVPSLAGGGGIVPTYSGFTSANTSVDITNGTPGNGLDVTLSATKYWTYGGKYDETSGLYTP